MKKMCVLYRILVSDLNSWQSVSELASLPVLSAELASLPVSITEPASLPVSTTELASLPRSPIEPASPVPAIELASPVSAIELTSPVSASAATLPKSRFLARSWWQKKKFPLAASHQDTRGFKLQLKWELVYLPSRYLSIPVWYNSHPAPSPPHIFYMSFYFFLNMILYMRISRIQMDSKHCAQQFFLMTPLRRFPSNCWKVRCRFLKNWV